MSTPWSRLLFDWEAPVIAAKFTKLHIWRPYNIAHFSYVTAIVLYVLRSVLDAKDEMFMVTYVNYFI